MSPTPPFVIRTCTLKELSVYYKCSDKTMRKWVERFEQEVGPRMGKLYTPRQVRVIVEKLGEP